APWWAWPTRGLAPASPSRRSSASGAAATDLPGRAWAWRSSGRPRSGTAAGRPSRARASRSPCRPSGKRQRTTARWRGNARERTLVRLFRTLPTKRLLVLLAGAAIVAIGGASIAVAAGGGGGSTPPPKPLAQALHDALAATKP